VTLQSIRCSRVRQARSLTVATILLVLVLGLANRSSALGTSRIDSPVSTTGHRVANVRSCLETKVLKTGGTSLRYPTCWSLSNYTEGSMMTTVIAFLSNEQLHQPCTTTHSGIGTTVRCGLPVRTLMHGGVLVMFIEGGMPGWKIANVRGQQLVVDHHAARETVIRKPHRSLDATVEYRIIIDRGVPDNFYEFDVFFRNPGVSKDQRLLQKMLDSMTID
jgi:hypothetical protein